MTTPWMRCTYVQASPGSFVSADVSSQPAMMRDRYHVQTPGLLIQLTDLLQSTSEGCLLCPGILSAQRRQHGPGTASLGNWEPQVVVGLRSSWQGYCLFRPWAWSGSQTAWAGVKRVEC